MAWHVILCSITYIDAPKKESNKRDPGRVVIYISVHLVSIYTLTFSNILLVLALNLTVYKSSYCKCSLAWCQARTFLLFTILTHPLQMREYRLQYASTDKNKKIPLVGFFISVSSLKVFGHSIHSERRRIYPGKSIQALQNSNIIISWLFSFRIIQPRCSGILLKLLCLFSFSFSLQNLYKVFDY